MRYRLSMDTSVQLLEAADRHAECFRLRLAGHDFAEIAKRVGYSGKQGAYEALKAELEKRIGAPCEEYRQLELARLDAIWVKLWAVFESTGDKINLDLVDRLIKLSLARGRLAGLMSPKFSVNLPPVDAASSEPRPGDLVALYERLRARAAEQAKPLDVIDHAPAEPGGPEPETNGHANGHSNGNGATDEH